MIITVKSVKFGSNVIFESDGNFLKFSRTSNLCDQILLNEKKLWFER